MNGPRRALIAALVFSSGGALYGGCAKEKEKVPPAGLPPLPQSAAEADPGMHTPSGMNPHAPSMPGAPLVPTLPSAPEHSKLLLPGAGSAAPSLPSMMGQSQGSLPPGHPGLPSGHPALGADPMGGPMNGEIEGKMPGGDFDPSQTLTGNIEVAAQLKDKVAPTDAVFVVARVDDGTEKGGMILAVKRFDANAWPIKFQLDGRDAMAPGTKFTGKVIVTVRVDKDGDAMSKLPGDLYGVAHLTIPAQTRLVVDKLQTAPAP